MCIHCPFGDYKEFEDYKVELEADFIFTQSIEKRKAILEKALQRCVTYQGGVDASNVMLELLKLHWMETLEV
jgi:hypothetical protein